MGNVGEVQQISVSVSPGDFDSLSEYLEGLRVPTEEIGSLGQAIEGDISAQEQPGPAVQLWMGRMMSKIGTGTLIVGANASGSLIANAVLKFLGVS